MPALWALGWTATTLGGISVTDQFTVFGAYGAVTFSALSGLVSSTGEIRWNGVVVDDPATFLVPPRVALTPQVPRLFSETLRDNLVLGGAPTEACE